MPIRVSCPSCGRSGRLPDHALGRSVQCPACQHRYVLTAAMAAPEGLELLDDEPAARPAPPQRATPAARPASPARRPAPSSAAAEDPYATDDDGYVEPPAWAVKPKAAFAPEAAEPAPSGNPLAGASLTVKLVSGVVLVLCVLFTAFKAFEFMASAPVPDAATVGANLAAAVQPVMPELPAANSLPVVIPALQPAAAVAAPSQGESQVAADARAAVAKTGPGDTSTRVLSTADIVAESEPSVALIKGNASSGTGFLVAPGLVATNAHVIDDEFVSDLEVRFVSADDTHKAPLKPELLYEDAARDIAFLAVKTNLKPLRVARSYGFRKGEDVTVIGSPGMGDGKVLENAISRGVMSTKTEIDNQSFYQLGIAINPGNSGGPVFDSAGRVIGIATLKSSKQEAMGFCIPVEDLHAALNRLASQAPAEADRMRSRHRVVNTVKGLGNGGALLCLLIDVRRAATGNDDSDVKELLGKLETVASELDHDVFPTFANEVPQIQGDGLIHPSVKAKVNEMSGNFQSIRRAYSTREGVGDDRLRPWKQTHRRLITELSTSLGLEVPKGMMVAFDDHVVGGPPTAMIQPPSLGSYRSRIWERHGLNPPTIPQPPSIGVPNMPGPPGFGPPGFGPSGFGPSGIPRPPSLRDRMSPRRGIR